MKTIFIREGDPYYSTVSEPIRPGEYEMSYIVEGGLVWPNKPLEIISKTDFKLVVVEKEYFEHGNGD